MIDLIDNLLNLASLESGTSRIAPEPQPVDTLVGDAGVDMMRPIAAEKSLELCTEIAAVPPLLCDRRLIGRVLSNLVGNAIKYTCSGGSVTLMSRPEWRRIRAFLREGHQMRNSVRTTTAPLRAVLDGGSARSGTGLGLYIRRKASSRLTAAGSAQRARSALARWSGSPCPSDRSQKLTRERPFIDCL